MRALVLAALVVACAGGGACAVGGCAPRVDGPAEQAQRIDRRDADQLERQLAALPGVTSAHVVLHRAFRDPFTSATTPASASILIVGAASETDVRRLVTADMPRPEIVVIAQPTLLHERSRALLALLAAIAVAAGALAWRARPRTLT